MLGGLSPLVKTQRDFGRKHMLGWKILCWQHFIMLKIFMNEQFSTFFLSVNSLHDFIHTTKTLKQM